MSNLINQKDEFSEIKEYRALGFTANITEDARFGVKQFNIGNPENISLRMLFTLMKTDAGFGSFFSQLLRDSVFSSFLLEMPPIRDADLDSIAEFVLIPVPVMTGGPDQDVYAQYFTSPSAICRGVVSFLNLGKDALLVVPTPTDQNSDYKNLKSFLNNASSVQQLAYWNELGTQVLNRINDQPIWVSVAGGGIPWLHFRLDERPKYYRYTPYRYQC